MKQLLLFSTFYGWRNCDNVERSRCGVCFFHFLLLSSRCLQIITQDAMILPDCTRGNFLIDPVPTITDIDQKMRELGNKWFGACDFWPGTGESV
jgi:hypothetical protein